MMCASPWTSESRAEEVQDRAHVDLRRLEQLVGDACGRARPGESSSERPPRSSSARRASVKPLECSPLDGQPDEHVARRTMRSPVTTRSSATTPTAAPTRSSPWGEGWPRIISGSCASSPPGISMPACSAPAFRPAPDRREHLRVGLLDREVVDHRARLGADADQVVHVHRDAVDPDRVEAARLLGDDQLRADAVRAERDPGAGRRAPGRSRSGPRPTIARTACPDRSSSGSRRARRPRAPPGPCRRRPPRTRRRSSSPLY